MPLVASEAAHVLLQLLFLLLLLMRYLLLLQIHHLELWLLHWSWSWCVQMWQLHLLLMAVVVPVVTVVFQVHWPQHCLIHIHHRICLATSPHSSRRHLPPLHCTTQPHQHRRQTRHPPPRHAEVAQQVDQIARLLLIQLTLRPLLIMMLLLLPWLWLWLQLWLHVGPWWL